MVVAAALGYITTPIVWTLKPLASFLNRRLSTLTRWTPAAFTLPTGGCDEGRATACFFSIKHAAGEEEDTDAAADAWLKCLVAGQYMSDSLLYELRVVEHHIKFWQSRMQAGRHQLFFAFNRGPRKFFEAVMSLLRLSPQNEKPRMDASDRVEQRIIALRTVRAALAGSLAQAHAAVKRLHELPATTLAGSVATAAENCALALLRIAQDLKSIEEQLFRKADSGTNGRMLRVNTRPIILEQELIGPPKGGALEALEQEGSPPANGRTASLQRVHACLTDWQTVMRADVQLWHQRPARALELATLAAHSTRRDLVMLPPWTCSPSRLQRHWLQYSIEAVLALAAFRFIVVRTPLCGSDQLQRWVTTCVHTVVTATRDNVVQPLKKVRDEFFETFQARNSTVSRGDLVASRESLQRMLDAFSSDVAHATPHTARASPEDAALRGMDIMMHHYEEELKHPLFSALGGTLPRSLLIQVQKVKVDVEAAMLELDQILRSNELTIAVTAALPAVLVAGTALYFLARLFRSSEPDLKRAAAPCRLAMVRLEQAIEDLRNIRETAEVAGAVRDQPASKSSAAFSSRDDLEAQGIVLLRVARLKSVASHLYTGQTTLSSMIGLKGAADEWNYMIADLDAMAAAATPEAQARIAARMHRAYSIFQA